MKNPVLVRALLDPFALFSFFVFFSFFWYFPFHFHFHFTLCCTKYSCSYFLSLLSLRAFRFLAHICCACRTQCDGITLRSLTCLRVLHQAICYLCVVVCDHKACIFTRQQPNYVEIENEKKTKLNKMEENEEIILRARATKDTCAGCRRVEERFNVKYTYLKIRHPSSLK